jgi:hypothetical protein
MSRGVLYIASGKSYVEEAKVSAQSLAEHNPSLPITLYTDSEVDADVFDQVVRIDEPVEAWGDSILSQNHFPYDKNLYLDADTYVCGDISDLFDILDTFDLATKHDASRGRYNAEIWEELDVAIPPSFPEHNCGVVVYNDCNSIRTLFEDWTNTYHGYEYDRNQPAFRMSLYESDVKFSTIPSEYNFRVDRVGYACGEVKILHKCSSNATKTELSDIANRINHVTGKRVITWDDYPCRVVPQSHRGHKYLLKSYKDLATKKYQQEGKMALIQSAINMLI